MYLGQRLQTLRIKQHLSQEALAEQLGVTRQSISKWELGTAQPDTEKIIRLCQLFGVTTDWLLLQRGTMHAKPSKHALRFGMYLITKHFSKSVDFYEKLLDMRASILGPNRFAQFFIDGICLSIMNEGHLPGHDYTGCGDHKFAFNFWTHDLAAEHGRIAALDIGRTTAIIHPHAQYRFFNVYDPDGNVIEITGKYTSKGD
ncbi:MAG: helix-turn-helix domain-containing protein [Defluviitaleaceae bacterium]|nr:helix-turn-helix domain-containing protein [Defluviitaleaceae bacterium]